MIIVAGSSHTDLSARLAKSLSTSCLFARVRSFSDQELRVQIEGSLYNEEVVLIQSTCKPANDHVMELLLLADTAKRAGAAKIIALVPYFGYGRQDRPSYIHGPISASLIANLLETSGIDRFITVDLHSKQTEGFFKIRVQNLSPIALFAQTLQPTRSMIVVSPDIGGLRRAQIFSDYLGLELAVIHKHRDPSGTCAMSHVIGTPAGKECLIIDDIIDTGDTLFKACHLLKDQGALSIKAFITHGVLSGNCLEKLEYAPLDSLVITNTIPHPQLSKKITVIDIETLIKGALLN